MLSGKILAEIRLKMHYFCKKIKKSPRVGASLSNLPPVAGGQIPVHLSATHAQ